MAIEIEKRDLRSFEIRKRKFKQRIIIFIITFILLVAGIGTLVIYRIRHKDYSYYQVIHTTERKDTSSANYLSYGTGVLRYSMDGAMAMDSAGNLLWDGSFEMKDPIADICGKYAAVSDRGYKTVQIYNGEGGSSTINVNYPIIKTEISNQGVAAILMEGTDANYIELFSTEGESLVSIRTINDQDGFPVDISLSDDGTKLVTSYVAVDNGSMQNKITFYNFDEVGQNKPSRIVGAFEYGQTLVPNIQFINNDTVCAFGDNKFGIYSIKEIPELKKERKLSTKIKSIFYDDKYIGYVLNNNKGESKYRILLYDLNGDKVFEKTTDFDYININVSGNEIILLSNQEWIIWRLDGKEKLHYKFDHNILNVFPVNNLDKYILIDDLNMSEVRLLVKQEAKK